MDGFNNQAVLQQIKRLRETTDAKEVAQLLSTGKWVAFYATCETEPKFCLGLLRD